MYKTCGFINPCIYILSVANVRFEVQGGAIRDFQ